MDVNIGKGITLAIDANALPAAAMSHVVYIGLRNILMDSHANIATDEPDYVAKATATAQKKLDALMRGEVRVAGSREGDPVKARVKAIVKKQTETAWRKAGRKVADLTDAAREKIAAGFDMAAITAMAESQIAAEKALIVDVADIIG